MANRPTFSAFFPAYNEEANLPRLFKALVPILEANTSDYEILIIDDGSRDRTSEVVQEASRANPKIRLIRHDVNQGYGAALLSGFRAAKHGLVFFSDSDNQFDLNEIPKLIKSLEGADVVSGVRRHRMDPLHRRMNAWLWRTLVNFLFDLRITDINCAFKVYRREILQKIHLERVLSHGACINTEILIRLKRAHARIVEIPVTHLPRTWGTQTGAKLSVILRAFKELFQMQKRLALEAKEESRLVTSASSADR